MQALSYVALGAAVVATLLFIPLVMAVHNAGGPDAAGSAIGIPLLGVLRLSAVAAALLLASAEGRMEGLAGSAAGRAVLLIGAAVLVEVVSQALHFLSIDYEMRAPYPAVFAVLATVVPLAFLVSGVAAANVRGVYWGSVGLAAAVGVALLVLYPSLSGEYKEKRAKEIRETEEREARLLAELAQALEGTGVVELAGFLHATDSWETRSAVLRRILAVDGYRPALVEMLTGDRRAQALYALHFEAKELPEETRDECWKAVGRIAGDLTRRLESGEKPSLDELVLFHDSVKSLGEIRDAVRTRHVVELELSVRAARLTEAKDLGSYGREWLEMYLGELQRAAP